MAKRTIDEHKDAALSLEDHDVKKKSKRHGASKKTGSNDERVHVETKEERRKRRAVEKLQRVDVATTAEASYDFDMDNGGKVATSKSQLRDRYRQCVDEAEEQPMGQADDTKATKEYIESAQLAAVPQAEIDAFLSKHFISISDPLPNSHVLRPLIEFGHLPHTHVSELVPFQSFRAPTPIQSASWPFLLSGRDVVGIAETGSGKTMAFAVPCIRHLVAIDKRARHNGVRAVIVSPTRELAMQSHEQVRDLAKRSGLQATCIYGGVPKPEQRASLKTTDIIIATPGRLNDFIDEGVADLSGVTYVVLDEADRMLDKGFEDAIRKIISKTAPLGQRQTVMFTATWPESVRTLAASFMTSPVKIVIGDNPSGDLRANARIVQRVEVVEPRNKEFRLLQLLRQYQSGAQKDDRILVFCLYKKEATRVEAHIRTKGIPVVGIHGDLSQEQRTRSLEAFRSGSTPVLVATDVAARGLDIPAVKVVINCTFPLTVEDYVHRIGRTGRAGKEGLAITLFTEHDKAHSGALINVLKAANQSVPDELLKFGTTVKKKGHDAYGAFYKDVDSTKTATKIRFD